VILTARCIADFSDANRSTLCYCGEYILVQRKPPAGPAAEVTLAPAQPKVFEDPAAVVSDYVAGVLDGSVPAGRLVIAAVKRHVHDLEHGAARGLWFDEDAAARVIRFFGFLRHWKGEWGPKNGLPGQVIVPEPWQAFILWCVFGWKRADGTRRYRQAYVEVPRKNGKTTLISGVGLYLLMADEEPGAEVYSFATKKEQARIVMNDAAAFIGASESLKSRLAVSGGKYVNNIAFLRTASKWEPLGADSKTQDGLNVHGGIGDELHEHRDGGMWGVIETATGARRQPLILGITTAGSDPDSFCGQTHEYVEKLLTEFDNPDGVRNDSFFGFISAAEKEDDWADPACGARPTRTTGVGQARRPGGQVPEGQVDPVGPQRVPPQAPEHLDGAARGVDSGRDVGCVQGRRLRPRVVEGAGVLRRAGPVVEAGRHRVRAGVQADGRRPEIPRAAVLLDSRGHGARA
jgi:hypothetical protein